MSDLMQWQERIVTGSFTSVVSSGTDADPSAILLATTPDQEKGAVLLQVTGGTDGVIYLITCNVTGSTGNTYQKSGYLAVTSGLLS